MDFRKRGRGGEREREKHIDVRKKHWLVASHMHAIEPGMCPDWESNPQPFGVQDDAPTNWATWPGLFIFKILSCFLLNCKPLKGRITYI